MDKKYVYFLFFDLRIVKKNAKMTLEHNAVIYKFGFLKMLLNFFYTLKKKDLGVFLCYHYIGNYG